MVAARAHLYPAGPIGSDGVWPPVWSPLPGEAA